MQCLNWRKELEVVGEERDSIGKELEAIRSAMDNAIHSIEKFKNIKKESEVKDGKILELQSEVALLKSEVQSVNENKANESLKESQIKSLKILNQKLLVLLREAQNNKNCEKKLVETNPKPTAQCAQAGDA